MYFIDRQTIDMVQSLRHFDKKSEEKSHKLGKIKITELDEPYFDLKWLLTQSKYKVFFSGLDKHSEELIDFKDVLSEEDKKMLFDVVNSILKRIYNE